MLGGVDGLFEDGNVGKRSWSFDRLWVHIIEGIDCEISIVTEPASSGSVCYTVLNLKYRLCRGCVVEVDLEIQLGDVNISEIAPARG